ncbi:MAG: hypothetical protein E6Q73_14235, partial [Pseudorhodobacter sp.]
MDKPILPPNTKLSTRLRFYIARTFRDEARLQALFVPEANVLSALSGRRVAVVGNARSLSLTEFGLESDSHDLVIRVNSAPIPDGRSHGVRTDWMAMSVRPKRSLMAERSPTLVLWMAHKRKRLAFWLLQHFPVFLNSISRHAALAAELGARPTTGLMLIDLCLRAGAETDLYGFDFFQTKSLSGQRSAAQVPHDFAAERAWVLA